MKLTLLSSTYAVCRLDPQVPIPDWIDRSGFWTLSGTAEETSIVCLQEGVPAEVKAERDWRILKLEGPIPFEQTGVLASLANPLAQAQIGIFALSTYDTDYLLVKAPDLDKAVEVFRTAGFELPRLTD